MRFMALGFLAFTATAFTLATISPKFSEASSYPPGTVVLDKNTLVLEGIVNDESVDVLIKSITTSNKKTLTLFINSPGGMITAGYRLINAMKASGKKITCLADNADSMAFAIFEVGCSVRDVMEASEIMQHAGSFGLPPQDSNKQFNLVELIRREFKKLEADQAVKMHMNVEDFHNKTVTDWWMYGAEAVVNQAADNTVLAICTPELINKTHVENRQVIMFNIKVEVSNCPLIKTVRVLPESIPANKSDSAAAKKAP